jgi:DNA-binding response OmpR family regulator
MEKIIGNLLANAVKFTPGGGQITLSVKRVSQSRPQAGSESGVDGFVEISIRDTGIGIPQDQLSHIFDRFYQAESSRGHLYPGTGIGLALVKELVELHHGEIKVQSVPGKGTEFTLGLPLSPGHPEPGEIVGETDEIPVPVHRNLEIIEKVQVDGGVEEKTEQLKGSAGQDKNMEKDVILVVEDNADVRGYIRKNLESLYILEEAVDGKDGIEKAKSIIPDLIISDVMMPEADGFQLCDVLKKDVKTSHIPMVLLTARASEQSIVEGLETGADDYITKPFNANLLVIRVKNLVRLRRQLQRKIQDEMVLQPGEISVSSLDAEFIKELQAIIEENLADPEFSVEQLAKRLYMSKSSLYKKLEALTGESPQFFIRSYRLKRAAQLLKAKAGNVTEVAFEVGFSSTSYFAKCFKEKFHRLPSDY